MSRKVVMKEAKKQLDTLFKQSQKAAAQNLSRYTSPQARVGDVLKNIGKATVDVSKNNKEIITRTLSPSDITDEKLLNRIRVNVQKGGENSGDNVYKMLDEAYAENIARDMNSGRIKPNSVNASAGKEASEQASKQASQTADNIGTSSNASSSTTSQSAEKATKKGGARISKYMRNEYSKHIDDLSSAIDSKIEFSDDTINKFSDRFRMNNKTKEKFARNIKSGNHQNAMKMVNNENAIEQFVDTAGTLDKAFAYKVPQMAAGGVATSWLVSNMSATKGQQTNAQLYGQAQPYR